MDGWCWAWGAGGLWDDIARLGLPKLGPGAAVGAREEAITLVRLLCGEANRSRSREFYQVRDLETAPVEVPPVWTDAVGPKSLAVTGRVADGWIPGHAADWLSPRYRESRPVIDEAALTAGRRPGDVAIVYNLPGVITATASAAPRDHEGRWRGGSIGQWVEELTGAVLEIGASGVVHFRVEDGTPADSHSVAGPRRSHRRYARRSSPPVPDPTTEPFATGGLRGTRAKPTVPPKFRTV
ncbi:LLM class flavin-dependent oxidoreductase [Streptomyces sp. NY05-11A]|uniref:LLM class flavin-dependent oxidoreductase n=1 Tax=Streptomyces soliscabiei TaxID=588897 RepID=UPI0029A027A0|nr:LLM class flavin-dependent oxidoreductase [Streptomyces sp. NY05-11A]MDX2675192.1 LLM class flavin-dependent oxidoreductase [Streptomyces sp. NY05-11A]